MTYRIRDWTANFENCRTREVKRMTWVPIPTKQDGDGYTELLDDDDGAAHFGVWVAVLQLAAKCETRGTLTRQRGGEEIDHDARSIARVTRMRADVVEAALERLVQIGWVEQLACTSCKGEMSSHKSETTTQKNAPTEQYRTVQDSTEQNTYSAELDEQATTPAEPKDEPSEFVFPCSGKGSPDWTLTLSKLAEYRESYPGVDVDAELRKARQWCRDNPSRRKTTRGVARFLATWLSKAQDTARGSPKAANGTGRSKYSLEPKEGAPF